SNLKSLTVCPGINWRGIDLSSTDVQGLSDVTIDELKELQAQITELKTKNAHQLLVHSDDLDWNTIAYKQFNSEHSAYDCYTF
uniref:Uncharacterized protein n=1 Tax=Amphimedon queenslandica TaxID=400682 RepID=A0A1X7T5S8_AMPQE